MLTGYIKHKTNLTIAEEQVGVTTKNAFSRNAESRRQSTSTAVNPIPYYIYIIYGIYIIYIIYIIYRLLYMVTSVI